MFGHLCIWVLSARFCSYIYYNGRMLSLVSLFSCCLCGSSVRLFLSSFLFYHFVLNSFYFVCVCLFDSFFRYDWLLLRFFQPVLSHTHINFLLEFVDLWFENMPSVKNNRIFMFIKAPRYRLVFISLDTYLSLFFFSFWYNKKHIEFHSFWICVKPM